MKLSYEPLAIKAVKFHLQCFSRFQKLLWAPGILLFHDLYVPCREQTTLCRYKPVHQASPWRAKMLHLRHSVPSSSATCSLSLSWVPEDSCPKPKWPTELTPFRIGSWSCMRHSEIPGLLFSKSPCLCFALKALYWKSSSLRGEGCSLRTYL